MYICVYYIKGHNPFTLSQLKHSLRIWIQPLPCKFWKYRCAKTLSTDIHPNKFTGFCMCEKKSHKSLHFNVTTLHLLNSTYKMLKHVATVGLWRRKEMGSIPSYGLAAGNGTVWSHWSRFPLCTGYTAQNGPLIAEQINCSKNPAEARNPSTWRPPTAN